jgi:hypothetical protein
MSAKTIEIKISQSMMKSYTDYKNGKECGLLFKAKYIDKNVETEPSPSMKEGIYFEYLATGALPRTGITPQPERDSKGNITTAYKRIQAAAELFKKIIKHHKIKILKVGYVVSTEDMTGILDIWAEWNGEKVVIDLKYSGLLDDKWNELGWETESLPMKDSIMIQGVHYKILIQEALNIEDVPFYYFVFNSKDETDMKIIRQNVDPDKLVFHKQIVLSVKNSIKQEIKKGFKAYPDYRKCKECPLFDTCNVRHSVPEIIDVYY